MKVVLAICARERPLMLARCLSSVAATIVPSGTDLITLIVENTPKATNITKECVERHGFNYTHEPRLGRGA